MNNWIKFEDKKPLDEQIVYTYNSKDCLFNIGQYCIAYESIFNFDNFKIEATHWMNPVAPKEK